MHPVSSKLLPPARLEDFQTSSFGRELPWHVAVMQSYGLVRETPPRFQKLWIGSGSLQLGSLNLSVDLSSSDDPIQMAISRFYENEMFHVEHS